MTPVYFSPYDAARFHAELAEKQPGLADRLRVATLTLETLYAEDPELDGDGEDLFYQHIAAAPALKSVDPQFQGRVPVFLGTQVDGNGEAAGLLTVDTDDGPIVPAYFDPAELQALIDQTLSEVPDAEIRVEALDLTQILQLFRQFDDELTRRLTLVPASGSLAVVADAYKAARAPCARSYEYGPFQATVEAIAAFEHSPGSPPDPAFVMTYVKIAPLSESNARHAGKEQANVQVRMKRRDPVDPWGHPFEFDFAFRPTGFPGIVEGESELVCEYRSDAGWSLTQDFEWGRWCGFPASELALADGSLLDFRVLDTDTGAELYAGRYSPTPPPWFIRELKWRAQEALDAAGRNCRPGS